MKKSVTAILIGKLVFTGLEDSRQFRITDLGRIHGADRVMLVVI